MSYAGYITKLKNVEKHPNADRLKIATVFGNKVIIGLDMEEGDMVIYFPTDGQLSIEFCEANDLIRRKDPVTGEAIGGYLDENKRHIRTMRLRGEISDGLICGIDSLSTFTNISKLQTGDVVDVLDGTEICRKYVPVKKIREPQNFNGNKNQKEKTIKFPNFHEHIDTKQLMYNLGQLEVGDICYITLKMHGTSGRTGFQERVERRYKKGLKKILAKILRKKEYTESRYWDYATGTRRVVLENYEGGFYGSNDFRQKYHRQFVDKLHRGETAYYEIVGFQDGGRPIMGTVSNKKIGDKEFVKRYGDTTTYHYGCEDGESDIYIYRMSTTNTEGIEIDYPWDLVQLRAEQMGIKVTMELDRFIYTTEEDLLERINKYADGVDPVGKTHIREGAVLRIEGKEKFKALKHKNDSFKQLEGIIKDAGILDMEEAEDLIETDN